MPSPCPKPTPRCLSLERWQAWVTCDVPPSAGWGCTGSTGQSLSSKQGARPHSPRPCRLSPSPSSCVLKAATEPPTAPLPLPQLLTCSLSTSGGSPSRSCCLGGGGSGLQYCGAARCAFRLLRTEQLFTFPRSKTHTEAFIASLVALGSAGCLTKALTIRPPTAPPHSPAGPSGA